MCMYRPYSWEGAFVLFPCDMRVIDYRCGIVANSIVTDDGVYRAAGSITAFSYSCTCDDRYNGPATTVNTVLFSN